MNGWVDAPRMPAFDGGVRPTVRSDLILGGSPFGRPDPRLVAALCHAGAVGILDVGDDPIQARRALADLAHAVATGFGVRFSGAGARDMMRLVEELAVPLDVCVLAAGAEVTPADCAAGVRVLVEVTSLGEARAGVGAGAHGVILRGTEDGGSGAELSTFILLQQVLAEAAVPVPVWVCGVGPLAAGAAVAAGAAGVLLDTQLALLANADTDPALATAMARMDGSSEPLLVNGLRGRGPSGEGAGPTPGSGLAMGQDAFLAAQLADRCDDVPGVLRAYRKDILDACEGNAAFEVFGDQGRRLFGTRFPVAQGPMTRVSDQSRFAAAVADHGALPFIALALSSADDSRRLLEDAGRALAGRPWGVGLLGFVPDEVWAAQSRVVADVRPPYAVVAGGQPRHIRWLEEAGVRGFLHVTSSLLLDQFLAAGVRRFVFEGAECGGHIGPRHSLLLWEEQIRVLLRFLDANPAAGADVSVLFAGGIHDARSSAIVSVMARTLTRRGATVGLLMGTAYLFTAEAVEDGAITSLFQQQLLAARRTELLETAPGHVTRCLAGPFAQEFQALRGDLQSRGASLREITQALEDLNLGRLRLAAKGIRRSGDALIAASAEDQAAGGLFMAGQVAVLRHDVTTLEELHRSVSTGAVDLLDTLAASAPRPTDELIAPVIGRAARRPGSGARPPQDIAIIGMACLLPGAQDVAQYWNNTLNGADLVTEVPAERWDVDTYFRPDGPPDTTVSKWGAFLAPVPFDPLRFGIPPGALASVEPAQLLALATSQRALEDAGYAGRLVDHSRTCVVFGAEAGSDLSNATRLRVDLRSADEGLAPELDARLPRITGDSFPGMLPNVVTGRIANRLNLGGPNFVVNAACASGLAAVDAACKELTSFGSDLALCGGVDLHNGINDYVMFTSVHALSPTGRSRPFDAAADGIALGEGVVCLVLKRLADATRDGDRVYAVIKGVGSASDGRALGLTAPHPAGQRRALERAYENAGISPGEVGLIEAHGTGTVVGDRTELTTLTSVFRDAGAGTGTCALGSVKSQIGHTKCAAGLAGMVKAALSIHTGVLPPHLPMERPNAAWDPQDSPFVFHRAPRPWLAGRQDRVAGVSAFGFGGTNFHVVLAGEDGGDPVHATPIWPAELFLFSGRDDAAVDRLIRGLSELAAANDRAGRPWTLRDLASSADRQHRRTGQPVRAAVVATDLDDLVLLLRRCLAGEHAPAAGVFRSSGLGEGSRDPGKLAFLFPGQGSQRPDMLADLFVAFPDLRQTLMAGRACAEAMYPPADFGPDAAAAATRRLADTRLAQPALGITELAADELLRRAGLQPDMLAGHSYGELVALCAAGAVEPASLLPLSVARADAIGSELGDDPGAMVAVAAGAEDLADVLATAGGGRVVLANLNSPKQTVLAGPTGDVEAVMATLRGSGTGVRRLKVAGAFHSPLVAGASERFAAALAGRRVHPPAVPVWGNRTARPYPQDVDEVRREVAAQLRSPVRFADQIEAMYAAGARTFIEAGPGSVLTGLVRDILGERPHRSIALEPSPGRALRGYLCLLAELAVLGVPIRTGWLHRGRGAQDVTGQSPPAAPGWSVDGAFLRDASGAFIPGALQPGGVGTIVKTGDREMASGRESNEASALVGEFLRNAHHLINAQRDVLVAHLLGGSAMPAVPVSSVTPVGAPMPVAPIAVAVPALPPPAPAVVTSPPPAASPVRAAAEPAPAAVSMDVAELTLIVRELISERTGYPLDMMEEDLDLEADLSIDSIRRAEIAGQLSDRLGLSVGALPNTAFEELTQLRSIAAIASWLATRLGGGDPPGGGTGTDGQATAPVDRSELEGPKRYIWTDSDLAAIPPPMPGSLLGRTATVLGRDDPLRAAVLEQLRAVDVVARVGPLDELVSGPADIVVYLAGDGEGEVPSVSEIFPVLQAALASGARRLVLDSSAAGLAGLARTAAVEYPACEVTQLEFANPRPTVSERAAQIVAEALASTMTAVVRRRGTRRSTRVPAEVELDLMRAGPDQDDWAERLGLDPRSVVVVVGGARGITARCAAALASATRCRLELIGRTPLPGVPEDPELAAARSTSELRNVLARRPEVVGRVDGERFTEVERQVRTVQSQREIAATLASLHAAGCTARYHVADVRDAEAVERLFADLYAEHGRIDGVVFGAGVLDDRLMASVTPAGFAQVFETKVIGARTVLEAAEGLPRPPTFAVLFGSIATLGNAGQGPYAAGNDALESLADEWGRRTGRRALTVHWGPWRPEGLNSGMISPELASDIRRRGLALIDPGEGPLSLLRELAYGPAELRTVMYSPRGWIEQTSTPPLPTSAG